MGRPKVLHCKCGVLKTDETCSRNGDWFSHICKACNRARILKFKYDKMSLEELEDLRNMHAACADNVDEYIIERFDDDS
jgi:hypothetical protein